jgi:two-component system, cell cycle response regulator
MTGRILIVDDVATNRIVLKVKLASAYYTPLLAASGDEALRIARREVPDLILLDLLLPDMSGAQVLAALRADPVTGSIPVVVVSSSHDAKARMAALAAGADDFLAKPIADEVLLARVRNLMRARSTMDGFTSPPGALLAQGMAEAAAGWTAAPAVAVVSADQSRAMQWRGDLKGQMTASWTLMSPEEALADRVDSGPDLYLIDPAGQDPAAVLRLVSDLRSRSRSRHAALCLVARGLAAERLAMAYDLGVNDILDAATPASEAALRLTSLVSRKRSADTARDAVRDSLRLAVVDPLTGLFNRRYALPRLDDIAAAAARSGVVYAVMIADLDHFKTVNDRHGHAAGDSVLAEVSARLSAALRGSDLIARIGGEEFLIVLPDTSLAEAQAAAQRLRGVIRDSAIPLPDGTAVRVTLSLGVAVAGGSSAAEAAVATIERADRALMMAKAEGRDRVTLYRAA